MKPQTRKHRVFVAVYLYLEKNGKVLLIRRCNTGWQDGNYSMVSGHIEEGETARQAMKREAREEANIIIKTKDMKIVHILQRKAPDREYIDFFITTKKYGGQIRNNEPEKCDEIRWVDGRKLPKNVVPYIPFAISKIRSGEFYGEYGFS